MAELLSKIKSGIAYLPERDIKHANGFIEKRDFESLYELVSAVHKVHNKKADKAGLFNNEDDERLDEIYTDLEGDVLTYLNYIEPDYKVESDYEELEDENCIW